MKHLLALSVGPVQEFIAAARKTRDLWYGSEILSAISKEVATSVRDAGADLIFPSITEKDASAANVVIAVLGQGNPADLASTAKLRAERKWLAEVGEILPRVKGYIRPDIWEQQKKAGVLEFYATWTPYHDDFRDARKKVMRLLAARKLCRDFDQTSGEGCAGLPKSSLDAARETVLIKDRSNGMIRDLRLSTREQLDIVGVVKRLGGGKRQYPSVSRIAAEPWLHGLAKATPEKREKLLKLCRELRDKNCLSGLDEKGFDYLRGFPFEGTPVYRRRHKELAKETANPESTLKDLGKTVRELEKELGEPQPYLAILTADGDHVGRAISKLETEPANKKFSARLSRFAGSVDQTVRKHHGCRVYAGGDDVLAFLPLHTCLLCARELHDGFATAMEGVPEPPTLSVGIAIGHFMEPLEDLLEYAREAEKNAKRPDLKALDGEQRQDFGKLCRNALAVHLHTRAGDPIRVRRQWSENLDHHLTKWAQMHYNGEIPDKAGYHLREMAREYGNWRHKERIKDALPKDVQRLLKRKKKTLEIPELEEISSAERLLTFANEIILARRITEAMRQAKGEGRKR